MRTGRGQPDPREHDTEPGYTRLKRHCNHAFFALVSRSLCKSNRKGFRFAPALVEMAEPCVDDAFATGVVLETTHRPRAAADLAEGAFDGVGGPDGLPVLAWAAEEGQQLLEVLL